jgi:hypothetical protein
MIRKTAISLILLLAAISSFCQDKLYKKNGEVIVAHVIEVGTDEIKYKLFKEPDGPIYAIDKSSLIKIVFENGRIETYKENLEDPELYVSQKKSALKIYFLSPLFGHTQLSYEKSIKPGRSWEATASIVGLGRNYVFSYDYTNNTYTTYKRSATGLILGAGYKFSKRPDFLLKGMKYSHLLQGSYLEPMFSLGAYGENRIDNKTNIPQLERKTVVFGSLMVQLGKQWVFGESMLLDINIGLGYVADNLKTEDGYNDFSDDEYAHHFTVIRTGRSPGFGLNAGLKLGILLK